MFVCLKVYGEIITVYPEKYTKKIKIVCQKKYRFVFDAKGRFLIVLLKSYKVQW
jgi:hypothetical protein